PPRPAVNGKRPGKDQFPAERSAWLTSEAPSARRPPHCRTPPFPAARSSRKPLADQGAVSVYDRTAVTSATSCRTSDLFGPAPLSFVISAKRPLDRSTLAACLFLPWKAEQLLLGAWREHRQQGNPKRDE